MIGYVAGVQLHWVINDKGSGRQLGDKPGGSGEVDAVDSPGGVIGQLEVGIFVRGHVNKAA